MEQYSFTILADKKLLDWKRVQDKNIPCEERMFCPSDGERLDILATVGVTGGDLIRVGGCDHCGFVGYIDLPTQKWIANFYASEWDKAQEINIEMEVVRRRADMSNFGLPPGRFKELNQFLKEFAFDYNRPVCEIGCGYGNDLALIKRAGFKNCIGVEYSPHRALIASRTHDLEIYTGALEDESVMSAIVGKAPIHIMIAHHVIEHVRNPNSFLEKISKFQDDGDYLVLSLPNGATESSLSVLLFIPHLSSFTWEGIERLLGKYNYKIVARTPNSYREIYLLAKKVRQAPIFSLDESGHNRKTLEKIIHSFDLFHLKDMQTLSFFREVDFGYLYPDKGIFHTILRRIEGELRILRTIGLKKFIKNRKRFHRRQSFLIQVRAPMESNIPIQIWGKDKIPLYFK